MKLQLQSPKKTLKAFLKQKPLRSEMDRFKANLIELLDKISNIEKRPTDESEEHLKNELRDFLRDTYYKDTNALNTKDKKDLVIHLGKGTDSEVGVIIEAKRPSNISEMISEKNANKKAFHELILYYFNERIHNGNNKLAQLIVTNINEWYIIDANRFDTHIYRNKKIKDLYETKVKDKKDNPWFYEEISKIIADLEVEIPCTYFDIREYDTILRNDKKEDDRELIALQKILSPQHLLKIVTPNDSNSLNAAFYKELLHIIGLEEAKEGGKNIIRRKNEGRNAASLIEASIEALNTEDVLHRIVDRSSYGSNKEEQTFNVALELCITWINRILFLKLLEGQLISYHQGDKSYRFLNSEMVHDYDELFKIFHRVLAVNIAERSEAIKNKYSKVPYLNSSLFEISELEDQTIKINSLDNSEVLELFGTTVLKDLKKKVNGLPALNYLFQFLDAYDFASEGTEDVQEDNKTIINASVLGKVFEKINGYKDGSIFTPAFITMYMCRQSIRQAIVRKFNETLGAEGEILFEKFEDLRNYTSRHHKTQDILKDNEIINSLHICDPAVGSGHFLVSALNEIISIKSELGILADEEGNSISGYEIEIINDELIITDPRNKDSTLEYKLQGGKPVSKEVQRLQKALFLEKQTIIENCLFGVDINPNSVKICRLRLWIELLKNAYYKEETGYAELETLPNIDINIKCGNSLLSRFDLKSDLKSVLKKNNINIENYKIAVHAYHNATQKDEKRELEKLIKDIKNNFISAINHQDSRYAKLSSYRGQIELIQSKKEIGDLFEKLVDKELGTKVKDLQKKYDKLKEEIDSIKSNAIYKNAFEWRFEFPEVLNENGDFIGFDVVLGNPPYVDIKGLDPLLVRTLFMKYSTTENRINLYSLFVELGTSILKTHGNFSYIMPNSILMNSSYSKIRNLIRNDVYEIVKLPDNIFSESNVIVETVILAFCNQTTSESIRIIRYKHNDKIDNINSDFMQVLSKSIWENAGGKFNIYLTKDIQKILTSAFKNTTTLENVADFTLGITPYDKYKGHKESQIKDRIFHAATKIGDEYKPIISGENIMRYYVDPTPKEYIKYGDWLGAPRDEKFFKDPRIIVRQIVSGKPLRIYAGYTEDALYFTQIGFAIIPKPDSKLDPKYLTAILNSKLLNFIHKYLYLDIEKELFQKILIENCKQFPIKFLDDEKQTPFVKLVDNIIDNLIHGLSTKDLEKQIDTLVYKLYDIDSASQEIINEI